jgi:DMSO/TMAO reductase YedYZ molybdopterin-dependent catalytic subunit
MNRSKNGVRLSRRELLAVAGGFAASSIVTKPRPVLGGILDRLFHGKPAVPTAPITPNDEFYVTSYRSPPTVRIEDWRLSVTGLVERPLTLTYAQLVARPATSEIVTLECIGNTVAGEFISTAEWGGVPLRDLLEEAGADRQAYDVVFHAADDYADGIRLERALAGDVLVAHRMNGVALPPGHGFPARIIAPGLYGMKSVQWLTRIELVAHDYRGYYQRSGWTDDATVKTTSRIDVPVHGTTLRGARHLIQGLAFAGTRGIRAVELSFDEGATWREATVEAPLSSFAWVFWRYDWRSPGRGLHSMRVRATGGTGQVQSEEEQPPAPDGATGLHEITARVEG